MEANVACTDLAKAVLAQYHGRVKIMHLVCAKAREFGNCLR